MTTLAGTISQPAATLTEVQDQVARRIHRKFEEYADDINDLKDKMLHALNMYRRASTLCLDVSATKPGNERQPGGERKLRSARDDNVVAGGGARGGGWRDQKAVDAIVIMNEKGALTEAGILEEVHLGEHRVGPGVGAGTGKGGTPSAAHRREKSPKKEQDTGIQRPCVFEVGSLVLR